jgi:signal transduction histidine kinase
LTGLKEATAALNESEHRLRLLTAQLLKSQENERRWIARDLHDDLGQTMALLKMQINALERKVPAEFAEVHKILGDSRTHVNEVIGKVRHLTHDLSPPSLEHLGLAKELQSLLQGFAKYQAAEVIAEIDDLKGLFPPEAEINLYRLFQEFLNNIVKHAEATQIKVIISRQPQRVDFHLEDNGKGFNPKTLLDYKNLNRGLGLVTMEERVRMLGGDLELQSEPGQGTRLRFAVPLANPKLYSSALDQHLLQQYQRVDILFIYAATPIA